MYLNGEERYEENELGFWGAIIGAAVSAAGSYVAQKKGAADAKKLQAGDIAGQKMLIDAQAKADIAKIKAQTSATKETATSKVDTVKAIIPYAIPVLLGTAVIIWLVTRPKGKK